MSRRVAAEIDETAERCLPVITEFDDVFLPFVSVVMSLTNMQ